MVRSAASPRYCDIRNRKLSQIGSADAPGKIAVIPWQMRPNGFGRSKIMTSTKQIEANRRNSLKSTGPRTPEGKAVASLNNLRHGLRARTVVLPGENSEDFHQLCDDLEAEWQPQSSTEHFYVEQMAVSQWKLSRVELAEKSILAQEDDAKVQIPLVERLWKHQGRLERSYSRAQRELERVQASRRLPVTQPEALAPAPAPRPVAKAASAAASVPEPAQNPPVFISTTAAGSTAPGEPVEGSVVKKAG